MRDAKPPSLGQENLSDIMHDFKKFTSKELIRTMERVNESRKEWIMELFSEIKLYPW